MVKCKVWPELEECNCIKVENKILYFSSNVNALCSIHIKSGMVEMVESLYDEFFDRTALISGIYRYKDEILCVPLLAEHIYMLDLKNGGGHTFPDIEAVQKGRFYNFCIVDQYCYMFPLIGDVVLKLDLDKRDITETCNIKKLYQKFAGQGYAYFSYSGCYRLGESIYMVMDDMPIIAEYHTLSATFTFHKIGGESPEYTQLVGCKDLLYIMGSEGTIYIWNVKSHAIEKILKMELHENETERFKHSVKYRNYLYLFKYIYSDEFIRINMETGDAEVLALSALFHVDDMMNFMLMEDGKFYFLSQRKMLYCIDFEAEKVWTLPLILNQTGISDFISTHLGELDEKVEGMIYEGNYVWTLENYIKRYVKTTNHSSGGQEKNIGALIYRSSFDN